MIVREWRTFDLRQRMLLQLLHYDFDCFFELRVATLAPCGGFQVDLDIRRDAMILDLPIAVEAVDCGTRRCYATAIDEFRIAPDTDKTAPCFLSDQRPETRFTEIPRQRVAA